MEREIAVKELSSVFGCELDYIEAMVDYFVEIGILKDMNNVRELFSKFYREYVEHSINALKENYPKVDENLILEYFDTMWSVGSTLDDNLFDFADWLCDKEYGID